MRCGDCQYTRRIPTCGFRQAYNNGIERKYRSIDVSRGARIIQEVYYIQQERQTVLYVKVLKDL